MPEETYCSKSPNAAAPEEDLGFQGNDIVLEYDILCDSIYHPTAHVTQLFGLPQRISHAQDYLIRYGIVSLESAKDFLALFRRIREGIASADCVIRVKTALGNLLWVQILLTTIYNEEGLPVQALGVLKDVTAAQEAALQRKNAALHRDILPPSATVCCRANLTQRKMLFLQEGLSASFDAPPTGAYDADLSQFAHIAVSPQDRASFLATLSADALLARYARGDCLVELDFRRLSGKGTTLWLRGLGQLAPSEESGELLFTFSAACIDGLKQQEQHLQERAERDSLTGLYNPFTTELRLREAMEEDRALGIRSALLTIGLLLPPLASKKRERLRADACLSALGQALGTLCGPRDLAGRGDEGVLLLYLRDLEETDVAAAADSLSQQLRHAARGSIPTDQETVFIGCALLEQGADFSALYEKAAGAMLSAQREGIAVECHREGMAPPSCKAPSFLSDLPSLCPDSMEHRLFDLLYNSKDRAAALQNALELTVRRFGFDQGLIYLLSPKGDAALAFSSHQKQPFPTQDSYPLTEERLQFFRRLAASRELTLIHRENSPGKLPEELSLCALYGFRGDDGPSGFLCLYAAREPARFPQWQETLEHAAKLLDAFFASYMANQTVQDAKSLLQGIVNVLPNYTYIIDPETHLIQYVNQNTQQGLAGVCPGRLCHEVFRGRAIPCGDCPITRMQQNGTTVDRSEMYLDSFSLWAKISASLITVPSGQTFGMFIGHDFSEQRRDPSLYDGTLSAFPMDSALYGALSLSTDDYIIMCDMHSNRFYFPRPMVEEFGLPGQMIENAVPLWLERIHEEDRARFSADIDAVFSGRSDTHNQEYRVKNKDGVWIWLRARGHVERSQDGTPYLLVIVLKTMGEKNKVDHITGLLDKYEFERSTRALLASGPGQGTLLILGLDNFRYINNIYGWEFGDKILRETSLRLQANLPERCQIYRLDSDKFGVFFCGLPLGESTDAARTLLGVFTRHHQLGGKRYSCTLSGGCAFFDGAPPDFNDLYKQAIYALDASKRDGKNRLTIYDEYSMSGSERLLALMEALHQSVENQYSGFAVHYQPQVAPGTSQVKSAEALLRWSGSGLGAVPPVEFIPLLEQTGLIRKVGWWVLREAAAVCRRWRSHAPDFTVSVNLSFVQLQDQAFLSTLRQEIARGTIDPSMLHLEITESCIADGSRSLLSSVESLRGMGFQIEMDDFGTGYSSLEILKNMPVDVVKIDHAFVKDITKSSFDATLIEFVTTLCHSVGIRVCLEGVETEEEYHLLEAMQLDLIQGFLFGKPMPEQTFESSFFA